MKIKLFRQSLKKMTIKMNWASASGQNTGPKGVVAQCGGPEGWRPRGVGPEEGARIGLRKSWMSCGTDSFQLKRYFCSKSKPLHSTSTFYHMDVISILRLCSSPSHFVVKFPIVRFMKVSVATSIWRISQVPFRMSTRKLSSKCCPQAICYSSQCYLGQLSLKPSCHLVITKWEL